MHISFETKKLLDILSGISKVVSTPPFIQFEVKNDSAYVVTSNEGFDIKMKLECNIKAEGKVAVEYDKLKSIFRNRKEIELKLSDSQNKLAFKAPSTKAFSGDLVVLETHKISFKDKTKSNISFDKKQSQFVFSSLANLNIEDMYFKKPLALTVSFSKKGGVCFVTSDHHMGFATIDGTFKDATITIPVKTFKSIILLADGKPFDISTDDSSVIATNKYFSASIPLESQEETQLEAAIDLAKKTKKLDNAFKVGLVEFKNCIDSMMALFDGKAAVNMALSKDELSCWISSSHGNVKEKIKVSGSSKHDDFSVHPNLILNVLKNVKSKTLKVKLTEKFLAFFNEVDGIDFFYVVMYYE